MIMRSCTHAFILAGSRRLVKAPRRSCAHTYGPSWGPLTFCLMLLAGCAAGTPLCPPCEQCPPAAGRYQIHTHGERTWRLNTATGYNCLLLTTEADWKKPDTKAQGCF